MSLLHMKQEPRHEQLPRYHSQNGSELWGQPFTHSFCEQCPLHRHVCLSSLATDDQYWEPVVTSGPLTHGDFSSTSFYKQPSRCLTPEPAMSAIFSPQHVLSPDNFKSHLFETHLPELDVFSARTQTSAGLSTEALWGLEWVHTVGVKSKPLQWVIWEQNSLQRDKSNFHFNIAGVWTSHITSHRRAM